MATFEITAPDGQVYNVTGETAEGAHAALMEMLGDQEVTAQAAPIDGDGYGKGLARAAAQGLSFGFGDEIEAFLTRGDGTYEDRLTEVRAAISQFAEQNPKTALGAELLGSVPTALLGGAGLARAGVSGAAKVAGVEGALYGFGAGEGGAAERAKSAAVGGTVGAVTGKGSDLLFPKVSDAARALMKKGVRLTPGQRVGGMTRAVEEKAKSIPFVGEIITSAEAQALNDFNRGSMNNVLRVLDKKKSMPRNLSGNEAYEFLNDAVNDAYNEVIPKMSVKLDNEFEDGLVKIIRDNAGLGRDGLSKLQAKLETTLNRAGSRDVSGEALRVMDADLGSDASNFIRSSTASERDLGSALFSVQKLLRERMTAQDEKVMGEYRRAQAAFREMLPVRSAVSKSSIHGGIFTPSKLLAGSRLADKSKDKIVTAKGKGPQQAFGQQAADVMGSSIPNSGTADRAAMMVLLNEAKNRPLQAMGYGAAAGAGAGLVYRTPLGRTVASGILQAPRAAGRALAPVTGGLLAQSALKGQER